jgi:hypothetical protein
MKCITLWQPWATWIALGWKRIETRTHSRFACLKGQRIAIHAGRKWDKWAFHSAGRWLTDEQMKATTDVPSGVVVCTAYVYNHIELSPVHSQSALIECKYTKRYGLMLSDVEPLTQPVPARGRQGIWNVELPE